MAAGCAPSDDEVPAGTGEPDTLLTPQVAAGDRPKAFWAEKVSLVHLNGSRVFLKLAAEQVVHRRRTSRLFVYENYDEIFLQGLRVEFPLVEDESGRKRVKLPLHEIEDVLRSLSDLPKAAAGDPDETGDLDVDVLSRLLIEDVAFRILPQHERPIDLNAKQAKIGGDFKTVLFEGGMTLSGANCEIKAPTALWSMEHDGFLLPAGYRQGQKQHRDQAFVSLTANGTCRTVSPVPDIRYVDPLEEQEAALYATISESMPVFARFMLGIPGSISPGQ